MLHCSSTCGAVADGMHAGAVQGQAAKTRCHAAQEGAEVIAAGLVQSVVQLHTGHLSSIRPPQQSLLA
jgi:hypothetical protein